MEFLERLINNKPNMIGNIYWSSPKDERIEVWHINDETNFRSTFKSIIKSLWFYQMLFPVLHPLTKVNLG